MGAPRYFCFASQRFGKGNGTATVIDPLVVRHECGRPVRYARLRCDCGTEYLALISRLYAGMRHACSGCTPKGKPKSVGGYARRNHGGWQVTLHVGWYKSEAEARDMARRARLVLLPAEHLESKSTLT